MGMSAARVKAMSQTIAAEMAPEMMQVDTSYYDKGECGIMTRCCFLGFLRVLLVREARPRPRR